MSSLHPLPRNQPTGARYFNPTRDKLFQLLHRMTARLKLRHARSLEPSPLHPPKAVALHLKPGKSTIDALADGGRGLRRPAKAFHADRPGFGAVGRADRRSAASRD